MSGTKRNRPELTKLHAHMDKGDTVAIESLSRLGRNTKDLIELVELFRKRGASDFFGSPSFFLCGNQSFFGIGVPSKNLLGFSIFNFSILLRSEFSLLSISSPVKN